MGTTHANGRYSLNIVGKTTKGAFVGKHRVRISMMEKDDPRDDAPKPPGKLQEKYCRHSPLEYDVPVGGTDAADFVLRLD